MGIVNGKTRHEAGEQSRGIGLAAESSKTGSSRETGAICMEL